MLGRAVELLRTIGLAIPLLALAAPLVGCQDKIGDPCRLSTDCSIRGDRICDLSHPVNGAGVRTPGGKGECTIEGCSLGSCPKEAECVKVYGSSFLSVSCDPAREDIAIVAPDPNPYDDCLCPLVGEERPLECDEKVCPPLDDCDSNEVCLPEGLCADEITARTSCRLECKKTKDCRNGYRCVQTGSGGVYLPPNAKNPASTKQAKICMPRPE